MKMEEQSLIHKQFLNLKELLELDCLDKKNLKRLVKMIEIE
jgi:hypothetical protein